MKVVLGMGMDDLEKILKALKPDVDFSQPGLLIDDGVLDSFDMVSLVAELNLTFDVEIRYEDLIPENFNTPEAIRNLIKEKRDAY